MAGLHHLEKGRIDPMECSTPYKTTLTSLIIILFYFIIIILFYYYYFILFYYYFILFYYYYFILFLIKIMFTTLEGGPMIWISGLLVPILTACVSHPLKCKINSCCRPAVDQQN